MHIIDTKNLATGNPIVINNYVPVNFIVTHFQRKLVLLNHGDGFGVAVGTAVATLDGQLCMRRRKRTLTLNDRTHSTCTSSSELVMHYVALLQSIIYYACVHRHHSTSFSDL